MNHTEQGFVYDSVVLVIVVGKAGTKFTPTPWPVGQAGTLHYTTLHYIIQHQTIPHYTTLHYITLHYTTLHYTTLHYTTLHYT